MRWICFSATYLSMLLVLQALALILLGVHALTDAAELPLFDAHIHYNHDAWESITPNNAIAQLRKAGTIRALVSSSSDEGTQKLYAEAPDLIIPELRPYRRTGETDTWFLDESVIDYLQERLNQYRYVAIGEFHVKGSNADLPVVHRMVQLATRNGLLLHAHSDADAVERLFHYDPEARIIWAHAGYEKTSRVREMLIRYRNLWPELSSRDDIALDGRLTEEWRTVLLEFPDRFMIGTDTHTAERWDIVAANAASVRAWLTSLPPEVAERIAYKNGELVLTAGFLSRR